MRTLQQTSSRLLQIINAQHLFPIFSECLAQICDSKTTFSFYVCIYKCRVFTLRIDEMYQWDCFSIKLCICADELKHKEKGKKTNDWIAEKRSCLIQLTQAGDMILIQYFHNLYLNVIQNNSLVKTYHTIYNHLLNYLTHNSNQLENV